MKKPVVVVLALLVLSGCGGRPATPAVDSSAAAAVPRPLNVQDPAEPPSPPATSPPACDPRASLRPPAALPAPGRMPAGTAMAKIAERGRLIVGIDQNAYLTSYRDPVTGQVVGFEIDLAREIARALLGNPDAIQWRAITTADRIPVLQRREVDMVIRTMTSTCERMQQVAFSTEYLTSGQRLLVNRGSGIKDFADLAGRKVCATRGSTSIVTIMKQPSKPVAVATDSTLDCLVMLQQGQVDAVSTVDVLLLGLAAQDPGTEVVGARISDEPSAVAMPLETPELVRFVNGVLDRIRADGTWTTIYSRWFAKYGPVPAAPPAKYRD
ncbi:glutamate ABC transporter substrate-binding protein [Dactylosporangium aurantiacum]|uniref:Glutamate ABC transporter substrate-binding protein n=1 Tax=Dactylosporangium aurantiacum TaxID=35754 RepID=A0A9Q9IDK9_9ACTN|nr:glutamate ABC transporter substrate-binding protein [Dactylosporangium aurantiacum]MDG6107190.1 glutamate ABC transporter substrate-binding protein [Dactylosporangium aurantiacum]UWZ51484.1 glutamate ABC transporter substrate-binding protein [Dactylosporangium aurantiacum]